MYYSRVVAVMKVSHFCGNVGETSTGCEWFETITLGTYAIIVA